MITKVIAGDYGQKCTHVLWAQVNNRKEGSVKRAGSTSISALSKWGLLTTSGSE